MGDVKKEVIRTPFKKAIVKETSEICSIEVVDAKKGRSSTLFFYFRKS